MRIGQRRTLHFRNRFKERVGIYPPNKLLREIIEQVEGLNKEKCKITVLDKPYTVIYRDETLITIY